MWRLLALAALLGLAGCGDDGAPASPPAPPGPVPEAVAVIESGEDEIRVRVEVADDQAERGRGLMFRESLPEDAGMIFVFDDAERGGFWMKDTLIPLSIAFYDGEGRIVRILDMEPCRADPCQVYDPGVTYNGALEVNHGAFREWGVEAGDRIRLER